MYLSHYSVLIILLQILISKITTQQVLAIVVIIMLTYINIQGVKYGKWIQTYLSGTKILALFGLIAIGIFVSNSEAITQNFTNMWDAKKW